MVSILREEESLLWERYVKQVDFKPGSHDPYIQL